jgi:hypothetical protein
VVQGWDTLCRKEDEGKEINKERKKERKRHSKQEGDVRGKAKIRKGNEETNSQRNVVKENHRRIRKKWKPKRRSEVRRERMR